ncbi:flavodoxin/nitric oxide synthase [Methanothermus fervidus DSM 2088]|uniref:Flavodoxin/nitric oxide synthase n=1 Tax=Methanothermus fervidus (strain ATCC 43054 / DSM 2088 / JCM 10308 / V24 S) TaxID=523846 RepID=E3GY45_METFV|nr:FprA family A-type flavoprotein [Methanothermus fervidus]ADP77227.1 flavodoxin/nitric oxide synthase [Methanothermus fervidus DSM 2088]
MKAKAVKIKDGVYWVGVLDWDIRIYHGYTLKGTTYNAYLVFGEDKTCLIDNTYPGTETQLWARIKDALEKEKREKIDVIVQNHVERDHSGALPQIHKKFPEAPIYCTEIAVDGLKKHYPQLKNADFIEVKTGDKLDLGNKTLAFVEAFLLHWPDSMFTLLVEDGILFPNDAFGQHLCYPQRYDYEIPEYVLMDAAQKFYANLITPLSKRVLKKFKEIEDLGLLNKIKMIAPSHGQIWTDPMKIIGAYKDWAEGKCKNKITIIYDTMHYSTQKMAHAIAEGIISEGVDVRMYYLHEDERSEIVKDILDSKAVAFGTPTIYDKPYPTLGDIIYYLKGLRFDRTGFKKLAITFGSMGGEGGAPEIIANELKECGFEVIDEYEIFYIPDEKELEKCYEIGRKLAKKVKEM